MFTLSADGATVAGIHATVYGTLVKIGDIDMADVFDAVPLDELKAIVETIARANLASFAAARRAS